MIISNNKLFWEIDQIVFQLEDIVCTPEYFHAQFDIIISFQSNLTALEWEPRV